MTPSRTPPSEPGDYVFTDGTNGNSFRVLVYRSHDGRLSLCYRYGDAVRSELVTGMPPGYWQPADPPTPYIPPEPPAVELWEGEFIGEHRQIVKYSDCVIEILEGEAMNAADDWREIERRYTNLRKIGTYKLEREA